MYYLKRNRENWDICNTNFQHVIESINKGIVFAIEAVRALNKDCNEECPVVIVLSSYEDISFSKILNTETIPVYTSDNSLLQLATNWGKFIPTIPFWAVEIKNERIMFCSSYARAKKVYDDLVVERLKSK